MCTEMQTEPKVSDDSQLPVEWGEMQELILELSRYRGYMRWGIQKGVGKIDGLELVQQQKLYIHRKQK